MHSYLENDSCKIELLLISPNSHFLKECSDLNLIKTLHTLVPNDFLNNAHQLSINMINQKYTKQQQLVFVKYRPCVTEFCVF